MALLFMSCSKTVMKITDSEEWEEAEYKFKKNGDFAYRKYLLGIIRQVKPVKGRYLFVNDTIYLVSAAGRSLFEYYARAVPDTAARAVRIMYNGDRYWRKYYIEEIMYEQLYRPEPGSAAQRSR